MISSIIAKMITAFTKVSRPRPTYRVREQHEINNLEYAVVVILQRNDIKHRLELEEWCGGNKRELLYNEVKKIAPLPWEMEPDPKKCVREMYQSLLPGYTNARIK
jgi:hypothetical protein